MSTIAAAPGLTPVRTAQPRTAQPRTAGPRTVRPRPASRVRLTRRGRLVLLAVFLVVAFAVLTVLGDRSAATGERGEPVPTRTVEVAEGQTLWEIAAGAAEPGEVREMVHQIQELNALPSAALSVGQEIAVPVG